MGCGWSQEDKDQAFVLLYCFALFGVIAPAIALFIRFVIL